MTGTTSRNERPTGSADGPGIEYHIRSRDLPADVANPNRSKLANEDSVGTSETVPRQFSASNGGAQS